MKISNPKVLAFLILFIIALAGLASLASLIFLFVVGLVMITAFFAWNMLYMLIEEIMDWFKQKRTNNE